MNKWNIDGLDLNNIPKDQNGCLQHTFVHIVLCLCKNMNATHVSVIGQTNALKELRHVYFLKVKYYYSTNFPKKKTTGLSRI